MDLLIEFAKTDLGIACVIADFVQDELASGRLIRLKSPASIPKRRIGFACYEEHTKNDAIETFLSFLRAHLPEEPLSSK